MQRRPGGVTDARRAPATTALTRARLGRLSAGATEMQAQLDSLHSVHSRLLHALQGLWQQVVVLLRGHVRRRRHGHAARAQRVAVRRLVRGRHVRMPKVFVAPPWQGRHTVVIHLCAGQAAGGAVVTAEGGGMECSGAGGAGAAASAEIGFGWAPSGCGNAAELSCASASPTGPTALLSSAFALSSTPLDSSLASARASSVSSSTPMRGMRWYSAWIAGQPV